MRYAWLAPTWCDSIEQIQEMATQWLWAYNHERPDMALGGITPIQKLALAILHHFWSQLKMGDYPGTGRGSPRPLFRVGFFYTRTSVLDRHRALQAQ